MGFLLLTALRDRIAGVSVAWKMSKTKGDMLAGNGTQKGQDENQLYGERRRSSPTPAQPSPSSGASSSDETNHPRSSSARLQLHRC